MPSHDPKIDAYIARAAPFARPVLEHLRAAVHAGCPDVEEAMKWSRPFFGYRGPLCGMGAFKAHCVFMLWKGDVLFPKGKRSGLEQFGHITAIDELPSKKELVACIKAAAQLNEDGVKARWQEKRQATRQVDRKVVTPPDLVAAFKKNAQARATWEGFAPSHRHEYAQWITEAKREETRAKRVAQAVAWLTEGKSRNWKYE